MEQLATMAVIVNNEVQPIVANTISFNDGLGEQQVKVVTEGNKVLVVPINNLETNIGMVKFSMLVTPDNIAASRAWKMNRQNNVVSLEGQTLDGKKVTRLFENAIITNSIDYNPTQDGVIEIEFKSSPAR